MTGAATYVYVGNGDSCDISAFRLDHRGGALSPIGTFAIPDGAGPSYSLPLAASPDRRLLFVAVRTQPWSVRTFAIEPQSGRLDYRGSGPLADNTCYISTDTTGRFLLSASYVGNSIAVNRVSDTGRVSSPLQVIETGPRSHSIRVDAANRYALSACLGEDVVYQWRLDDESGRLTPNDPPFVSVCPGSGPRHFIFHPNGAVVYLLNEHTATIAVFDYDRRLGTLRHKQTANALTPHPGERVWASDIHITPNGRFLYAAERGSSTLAILKVDPSDATLSLESHVDTEAQPRGFAIDPTGRFLYCAGQLSHRMSSYAIDEESGQLTKIADHRVGRNPNWIEVVQVA